MSTVHGGEGEELEESDRAAQLAALPTLESLSTLEPVVEEANIWLTPLRGGAAAAAVIEESTQGAAATKAENAMWQYIVDKIEADGTGLVVSDVVPGGRASLSFVRSNTLRHRRNGVLMLRIAEFYVTHTVQAFKADVIVASTPKQVTHEVSIPKALFPARVLEQINTQLGAAATVKKAWDDDDEMVYCIVSTSEAMTSRIEKNGLVLTVENTKFEFKRVVRRVTLETIYVFGVMGKGSAERDLVPAVASAFALSSDLVRMTEVGGLVPGCGFVAAVKFPFSSERYDMVYELIELGSFALYNSNKPNLKPLEVFVAPSLVEMQHLTGVKMLREPVAEIEEVEIIAVEPRIVEVTPPRAAATETRCVLFPALAWRMKAEVGRRAAVEGRRRARARVAIGAAMAARLKGAAGVACAGARRTAGHDSHAAAARTQVLSLRRPTGARTTTSTTTTKRQDEGRELPTGPRSWWHEWRTCEGRSDAGSTPGHGRSDATGTGRAAPTARRRMERLLGWGYGTRRTGARK